tara:strand:- start:2454 stop:3203 length:750 start_codon:yes stop_codon:yes gene_type:complete
MGAIFYCSTSGGKDSQAMAIRLRRWVPADQIVYVHADLGTVEWQGVQSHINKYLPCQAELNVVRAIDKHGNEKTLLSEVERKAAAKPNTVPWPSSAMRWCTSDLKRGPIYKFIRNDMKSRGATRAINCMGLRAQESTARAKLEHIKLNKMLSKAGRTIYDFLPIHDWSTEDVFGQIEAAGETAHPAYAGGNERLSCMFCIMGSPNDLRHAARENPELAAQYIEIEERTGHTLFHKKSLAQIIATDGGAA